MLASAVTKAASTLETPPQTQTPYVQEKRPRIGSTGRLDRIPGEEKSMANLAGVVQQLRKERYQAARTLQQLDAALAALNGDSYGRRTGIRRKISAAGRARIAAS
jgi:hypothetical protein